MDNVSITGETPSDLTFSSGHVHVWTVSLEPPAVLLHRLAEALSLEEQQRAARFRFDLHRNRFIAGRGLLRFILSLYLRLDPGQIKFVYGSHGKPALAPSVNPDGLQFNLAHSDALALVAVSRSGLVGIDIEHVRPLDEMNQLVERFFAPRESRSFQKLPARLKPSAFFNLWTRKEAWLKATGDGIAHYLNRVEVSFLPGEPARLLSLPSELPLGGEWSLYDLTPPHGFAAALAVGWDEAIVSCRRWRFPGSADNSVGTFSVSPQNHFSADESSRKRESPLCQTQTR